MSDNLPSLKRYAEFLLQNHLDAFIQFNYKLARDSKNPIFRHFKNFTEDQIFEVSRKTVLEDLLSPLANDSAWDRTLEMAELWKVDKNPYYRKQDFEISDVQATYNNRKNSLIEFLNYYPESNSEIIKTMLDIECHFNRCLELATKLYNEIQSEHLREKNVMLEVILEKLPVIITKIDREGKVLDVFGSGFKKRVDEPHEYKGYNVFDLYPEAIHIKKVMEEGDNCCFVGKAVDKNGVDRYYENYFFPEAFGAFGFSIDVTERQLADQKLKNLNEDLEHRVEERTAELRSVEERLRLAITTAELGTWDYIPETDELFWDKRSREVFEIPDGQKVISEFYANSIHPDDKPWVEKEIYSVLGPGSNGEFDNKYRIVGHISKKQKWIRAKGKVFFDEQKKPTRFIGTFLDITEIQQALEELQCANVQLSKMNADLDNFVYTASHDLKAPVSNIEGLIYTLVDSMQEHGVINAECTQIIWMIEKSVKRFQETIKGLTDISRVQKNLDAEMEKINVANVVMDTQSSIANLIEESGAIIKTDTSASPEFHFSKANFKSIVFNLINNAVKYRATSRKPLIEIRSYKLEEFDVLEVKDNGIGIKSDYQEKIFGMFKRYHSHVEGTGVGLYLVKRIIDNAGGKIEVNSIPEEGTVFKVYFKSNN